MKNLTQDQRSRYDLIMSKATAKGGWTYAQLREWGISTPPKKGWKSEAILYGFPNQKKSPQQEADEINRICNEIYADQIRGWVAAGWKKRKTSYGLNDPHRKLKRS